MEAKPSIVQSIRIPLNVWKEIKELAEVTDRSFNRVVLRMLQKQLEQENKQKEGQS